MTFHGFAELLVGCSSWKADLGVEREEPGVITMSAGRGTRAHVADFATIVSTLGTRAGYVLLFGNVRIKVGLFCRDIIEDPVCKTARSRRIGIMKNQSKALGLRRSFFPGKLRRDVVALTSETTRNGASRGKIQTCKLHGSPPLILVRQDLLESIRTR